MTRLRRPASAGDRMEQVVIESIKRPGTTKSVAPVFASILVTLGLYRRRDVVAPGDQSAQRSPPPEKPPAKKPKKKREYKRRDLRAEE